MSDERTKVFDPVSGFAALRELGELFKFYLFIVLGILSHWIWEVLVAAVQSGKFEFGSWVIIVARIGIAFIVGLVSFMGIWKQLEKIDPKLRIFVAITQGFAVDALAAPVAAVANS